MRASFAARSKRISVAWPRLARPPLLPPRRAPRLLRLRLQQRRRFRIWRAAVRRAVSNRIELDGIVADNPDFRTTPNGNAILRVTVECGDGDYALKLAISMAGDDAREAERMKLRRGDNVAVTGSLRQVATRTKAGMVER